MRCVMQKEPRQRFFPAVRGRYKSFSNSGTAWRCRFLRRRITRASDVIAFSDMTGDRNPLHYDQEVARRTVFGRLIVQGGVTSGLLNALVAENLPGPGTVFLAVEWKFVKAVGIGEEIIA